MHQIYLAAKYIFFFFLVFISINEISFSEVTPLFWATDFLFPIELPDFLRTSRL